MTGILYVVATPIGNLEDVTLRALRVLREVSIIAAEDTRRTARLLQHYSISTPTTSLHEHNERSKTPSLIARMTAGESIALVSDAGTPVVSDPGAHLVAEAHRQGVRVEPIPGPSAAIAALSASGFAETEFLFAGFPPQRSNARKQWLAALADEPRPVIIYEAPHRIKGTLEDMLEVQGDRLVALARELTKAHEQLVVRPISDLIGEVAEFTKGEYTLVVSPRAAEVTVGVLPGPLQLLDEFGELTKNISTSRREALRILAKRYNVPVKTVYVRIEESRK
ncbi:MAG: 16S rRNA (cytidine(1402)-2'-O)-methyltransferase [Acidobacteria bacterium RIFCSPLOWO2_02_FULL_67_36]|nr:MAG: 16S rRNA (cytidine(1402)-2'-O)-methyltransferase [Acidobacteria bacterium RIFCSPLOWO2_02_FULL_67_36]OFW22898.1 MAG: 16S rRNA (cytidine(1402)-2'-O)-methyltransferase [Acidobacteria bacterium RIFCSPLOWO2_12_FULL_66_21]